MWLILWVSWSFAIFAVFEESRNARLLELFFSLFAIFGNAVRFSLSLEFYLLIVEMRSMLPFSWISLCYFWKFDWFFCFFKFFFPVFGNFRSFLCVWEGAPAGSELQRTWSETVQDWPPPAIGTGKHTASCLFPGAEMLIFLIYNFPKVTGSLLGLWSLEVSKKLRDRVNRCQILIWARYWFRSPGIRQLRILWCWLETVLLNALFYFVKWGVYLSILVRAI